MQLKRTDGTDPDFVSLCDGLEEYLNDLAGGREKRVQYHAQNRLDEIHHVVVAYQGNVPVGSAGFRRYDGTTAELKRLFVRPAYRKQGIARAILSELERMAVEQGYTAFVLETAWALAPAVELYRTCGFAVMDNYGPYRDLPMSVCMKKEIQHGCKG